MNTRVVLILVVLIAFGALTGYALYDVGVLGILRAASADSGAIQIFVDLVIVCALACVWMFFDGRKRGLNPWPYVVITLFTGSFGPLLYLLRREWRPGGNAAPLA